MPDQYIAAIGKTDDAEATTGDGSMIALLKRLRTLLITGLPISEAGGLSIITWPARKIHDGDMYQASYKTAEGSDLADNASMAISFKVPDTNPCFMGFGVSLGGTNEIKLYEGAAGVSGTLLDNINMNRWAYQTEGIVSAAEAQNVTSVTATGTLIHDALLVWSVGGGGGAAGDLSRVNVEWVLHTGTTYMLRVINRSGGAQSAGFVLQWYEDELN